MSGMRAILVHVSALGTTAWFLLCCSKATRLSEDTAAKVYAKVNTSLWLNCSLTSTSVFPGQVSWRHNNKSLDNSSSTSIIYRQDTQTLVLNISAVSFLDGGPYHCGYQSSGGFTVINKYAVVIGDVPQPVDTHKCYKAGYPPSISIWWPRLQTQSHELELKYTVFFCKPMQFPHFCFKLHKEYNSTGQCTDISATTNNRNNMFCNLTPVAKKLFPNLYSGSTDVRHKLLCTWIRARNALGTSDSQKRCCNLLQKIDCNPPSNLSAIATTERQLKILWDVPSGMGYTKFVLFYSILYLAKGDTRNMTAVVNVPSLAPGLALSYTLIRLQPYTEYTVNVTCGINNFDFGKFAGPVTATTLEEAPGSAPHIQFWEPVSKNGTKRSVKIYWKLPPKASWHGRPERVVIEYWKSSSDSNNKTEQRNITVNNGFAESLVLEDLDLTANYTAVVRLCTGGGCSDPSGPAIIPAEQVKDQKNNNNSGSNKTLIIALGVGLGVVLPLACIVVAVVAYMFCRRRMGPRARPLTDILDNLEVYTDRYEQPALSRQDGEYDNDPLGSGQRLLADEKPDNSSRRTSLTGDQASGYDTQQTTSSNERYVLLGNEASKASKRNCSEDERETNRRDAQAS